MKPGPRLVAICILSSLLAAIIFYKRLARREAPAVASAPPPALKLEAAPAPAGGPAQPTSYKNEDLIGFIEQEKKRLGITLAPKEDAKTPPAPPGARERKRQKEASQAKMRAMTREIRQLMEARKTPPVPLKGDTVLLLSSQNKSFYAQGSPIVSDGESSRPESKGLVLRSQEDLDRLWDALKSSHPKPKIDFSRQMLVAVVAAQDSGERVAIMNLGETRGKFLVRYRRSRLEEAGSYFDFLVVDRTEQPVRFQKSESTQSP